MRLPTSNYPVKKNFSQVCTTARVLVIAGVVELTTKKSHCLRKPQSLSRVDLKDTGK